MMELILSEKYIAIFHIEVVYVEPRALFIFVGKKTFSSGDSHLQYKEGCPQLTDKCLHGFFRYKRSMICEYMLHRR